VGNRGTIITHRLEQKLNLGGCDVFKAAVALSSSKRVQNKTKVSKLWPGLSCQSAVQA